MSVLRWHGRRQSEADDTPGWRGQWQLGHSLVFQGVRQDAFHPAHAHDVHGRAQVEKSFPRMP